MKQETRTSVELRQRRFYLVLPVLVLPFITLLFWIMGGGNADDQAGSVKRQGLDLTLPAMQSDKKDYLSKMDYYHQAALDSIKRREQIKNDPYYGDTIWSLDSEGGNQVTGGRLSNGEGSIRKGFYPHYDDPNEAKVYQKLGQLNAVLNKTDSIQDGFPQGYTEGRGTDTTIASSPDIDRLEQMMQLMSQPEGPDPEMKQLDAMLEKILDIQHPDRLQERVRDTSKENKGQVFAVSEGPQALTISCLENNSFAYGQNGFYSLNSPNQINQSRNTIPAAIYETQTIVNGSTVKLRLLNDIYINGILIPRNNFLFGEAVLDGERLKIVIKSIRYKNSLFPVQLSVYDLDGIQGIYIPGAIARETVKQSADRAIQNLGMTSVDPSVGVQAASAGIEAARNLIGKKVKQVKVTVKAGYRVLIVDAGQKRT